MLDGPGAKDLLSKSKELFPHSEPIVAGSIVNYDLIRRKNILYNLIIPQQHEVELIPSIVVRSDGTSMNAEDYFASGSQEYGKSYCAMDSILLAMCDGSDSTEFDIQRLSGRSHEDIEIQRSFALEHCYREIVEAAGSEGLVLKDLSSPYYLGAASRSLRYWYKLKPDYNASGQASDIDVLVLGGNYADGFRQAGFFSALLVGIIDDRMGIDEGNVKYLTLCKVNFNRDIEQVMKTTGFQKGEVGLSTLMLYCICSFVSHTVFFRQRKTTDLCGWVNGSKQLMTAYPTLYQSGPSRGFLKETLKDGSLISKIVPIYGLIPRILLCSL